MRKGHSKAATEKEITLRGQQEKVEERSESEYAYPAFVEKQKAKSSMVVLKTIC